MFSPDMIHPDFNVKPIPSKQVTLDEHFLKELPVSNPKHKYDLVYQHLHQQRLQKQWKQGHFTLYPKIQYKANKKSNHDQSRRNRNSRSKSKKVITSTSRDINSHYKGQLS
mgnify:CR=1 FL=1